MDGGAEGAVLFAMGAAQEKEQMSNSKLEVLGGDQLVLDVLVDCNPLVTPGY